MTYEEVVSEIAAISSGEMKRFTEKLTPTQDYVYGVRVPDLRALAKRIREESEAFLAHEKHSLEEKMLHGFILCYRKRDFAQFRKDILAFVPMIDNWAVCDCVAATCKAVGRNRDLFSADIERLAESEQPFARRFASVLLLDYYTEEKYAPLIFSVCERIKRGEYYVDMAIAWLLSVCYVKMGDLTGKYLAECTLEESVLKKTERKILESFRVSEEEKRKIRKDGVRHLIWR
mgnify:CR=1 FL=1